MRKAIPLFLLLTLPGCAGQIWVNDATPAFIELAATPAWTDPQLTATAQAHCQQGGRNAVPVERINHVVMPNWAGGRIIRYVCR